MERCAGHDQLVKDAGMATAAGLEHGKQLSNIFTRLIEIKTAIDQNHVKDENRDLAISALQDSIEKVDRKIENGLRHEISCCASDIRKIMACVDQRKIERKAEARRGIRGFLAIGWTEFRHKTSFLLVTSFIVISAWFVMWVASRIYSKYEGPAALLKLFGIG
jgi:hypothetical protein